MDYVSTKLESNSKQVRSAGVDADRIGSQSRVQFQKREIRREKDVSGEESDEPQRTAS